MLPSARAATRLCSCALIHSRSRVLQRSNGWLSQSSLGRAASSPPFRRRSPGALWRTTWKEYHAEAVAEAEEAPEWEGQVYTKDTSPYAHEKNNQETAGESSHSNTLVKAGKKGKPVKSLAQAHARRKYCLQKLDEALLEANDLEIERWYFAFREAHVNCRDRIPAVLHLSSTQLNRMLSVWAGSLNLPEQRPIDGGTGGAAEEQEEAGLERDAERGARRAFERCRTLLSHIDKALDAEPPFAFDPLRIVENSQDLLRRVLLKPHLGPRRSEEKGDELVLDRLLSLVANRSRSTSPRHLLEALRVIRHVLPRTTLRKWQRNYGHSKLDQDAAEARERTRLDFYDKVSERPYLTLLQVVAESTPRTTFSRQDTPAEQSWRLRAIQQLLSDGSGSSRHLTKGDSFDVLEDLLRGWVPGSWSSEQALAAIASLWHGLANTGSTAYSSAYSSLCIFAIRSTTLDALPSIVQAAVRAGVADTNFFNAILRHLPEVRPKTADNERRRKFFRSAKKEHNKVTLLQDPRNEERLVLAIYEAMRDNLVTLERERWQNQQQSESRSLPRHNVQPLQHFTDQGNGRDVASSFRDHDDPLSTAALAQAGGRSTDLRLSNPDAVPTTAPSKLRPSEQLLYDVLGIETLPLSAIPDAQTYSQVIKSFSWHGSLHAAISVMEDMVHTPIDAGREPTISQPASKATNSQNAFFDSTLASFNKTASGKVDEPTFLPGIDIYDSIFRGFARHGVPAELEFLNEAVPSASRWTLSDDLDDGTRGRENEEQRQDWNVHALTEVLDAFLQVSPRSKKKRHGWFDPYPAALEANSSTSIRAVSNSTPSTKATTTSARWDKTELSYAPSPNQFFWILTALRRVSGDHARWVLLQWNRIWAKFSLLDWHALADEMMENRERTVQANVQKLNAREAREDGREERHVLNAQRSASSTAPSRGENNERFGSTSRRNSQTNSTTSELVKFSSSSYRSLSPTQHSQHSLTKPERTTLATRTREAEALREKGHMPLVRAVAVPGLRDEHEAWHHAMLNPRLIRTLLYLRDKSFE